MIAIDTNILIYSCDNRDPNRRDQASRLLEQLRDGIVPWQVACEFLAAIRKLEPQGFTAESGWDILLDYLQTFSLLMPTSAVLTRARGLHVEQHCSFWDAMFCAACLETGIPTLISEDVPGLVIPGLTITNPFACE